MARGGFQIVVIEDNPANPQTIRESIRQALPGCTIAFTGGAEAIRRVAAPESSAPDLPIFDLRTPAAEGLPVPNLVHSNTRRAHVPVVLFTASQSTPDAAWVNLSGPDRYRIEPADLDGVPRFGEEIKRRPDDRGLSGGGSGTEKATD